MQPQTIDILLAEDNEDDALLVRRAFRIAKHMHIMHVARDGQEALAFLRREAPYEQASVPGLALLDINMPRKNGFEVLQEMRNDPGLRQIPVVILTTSVRDEDIARSYSDGACSYVSKPLEMDRFNEVVLDFERYWTFVSLVPRSG